ncbi:hypothetical protein V6V47_29360 [Micromonospora sp. CPCC 205539]|uniref:hypothetical protein n=1 Tax=Micromonospora sp. CPCC 205539 TaxID=3122408 RepID=UPI002FEF99CE
MEPTATAEPAPPITTWVPESLPSERTNRTAIIVAASLGGVVLLLLACLAGVGGIILFREGTPPTSSAPFAAPTGAGPTASAAPDVSESPEQQGPQASAYPAKDIRDLDRVCEDDVYYPESPKRAGKAPHPLVLLVDDGSGLRVQNSHYYYSQGLSDKVEQSWASEDPKKVQTVACLDRVSAGATIRTCKFDDPKPQSLPLVRAGWKLRVYEVATGRKLLDKSMAGDDQKCPFVVMVGADRKIYAEVSDRALVAALRNFVNK